MARTAMRLEVGAGFEPAADTVLQTAALPTELPDHVPGFRRAGKRGKKVIARFRLVHPQGYEPRRRRERGRETRPGRMRSGRDCGQSPYEQLPGGRAFYMGMDTQYPDTIKRGRSSCLRNRGGGTGRIRTGTMYGD